jgi:hypothetical protein
MELRPLLKFQVIELPEKLALRSIQVEVFAGTAVTPHHSLA